MTLRSRYDTHPATTITPAYRSAMVVTPHQVSTVAFNPAASGISMDDRMINAASTAAPAMAITPTHWTRLIHALPLELPGAQP
ncbi:MAG: hypothetical protein IBJ10_02750 [Phycisphaerales bacterium]|nr:hypothetical protein [Phycisphaerales bacterium]